MSRALAMARRTLDAMADGGIRDQLGGGLPPLRHRCDLARAPLRADALRQRPARAGLRPRVAAHRRPRATAMSAAARSTTSCGSCATTDGAFAASQDADTDGEEGGTFVWTAEEIRRGPRRPRRRRFPGGLRRDRRRQLGGRARSCSPVDDAAVRRRRPTSACAGRRPRAAPRASRAAARSRRATTRPSRPGTGWRSRRSPTRRSLCAGRRRWSGRAAAARRGGHAHGGAPRRAGRLAADRGRTAGLGGRGPRGPRRPRGGPARALRGDVRRALVRRRARARRHHPRALRATRHGGFFDTARRSTSARRPPEGPPGQRHPVGQRDGDTVLLRLAALTGEGRYRSRAERALRLVEPFSGATRQASPSGSSPIDLAAGRSSRSPSSASRPTRRPIGLLAPTRDRLPAAPRRGRHSVRRRPAPSPLLDRQVPARRPADGVRLPRLRLSPAGPRARGARCPDRLVRPAR